jgi:hypothetical protein
MFLRSRTMRCGGACGMYGREDTFIHDFVGEISRMRPLRGTKSGWDDKIKIDFE